MARRLAPLTLDTLGDLPTRCRTCVVWELDPVGARKAAECGDTALDKEFWVSATLLDWGSCGRVAYVDDVPAGFVTYAPAHLVPRSVTFPTSPISADAVLLMTARVLPQFTGGGLARMMIQAAAKDLTRRGIRAIEAFASTDLATTDPLTDESSSACLLPQEMLLAVGFKTIRTHARYPRLRLDLKTAISWREDVEQALERILGTVRAPVLSGMGNYSGDI